MLLLELFQLLLELRLRLWLVVVVVDMLDLHLPIACIKRDEGFSKHDRGMI